MAIIEVCSSLRSGGNGVTIRWVPAHQGSPGNEKADEYTKIAAHGSDPSGMVADDYRWETSISRMAGVTAEARTQSSARWAADRIGDPRRKYRSPNWKRPQTQAPQTNPKFGGKAILPTVVRPCHHRPIPEGQNTQDSG